MEKSAIIIIILGILIAATILFIFRDNLIKKDSYNVKSINYEVKKRLDNLFNRTNWTMCEEMGLLCEPAYEKTVINLKNYMAETKGGKSYGVAFAIKNVFNETVEFNYEVGVYDAEVVQSECKISKEEVLSLIKDGKKDSFTLAPDETYYGLVKFNIPKTAQSCVIRNKINVEKNAQLYDEGSFDIAVK